MRYQQPIYNQTGGFVRNRDHLNVNMSSDMYVFYDPHLDISGATKIMSGITSADTGVYILANDGTDIDFVFTLSGESASLSQINSFTYEIYKFDHNADIFREPALYVSRTIPLDIQSGSTSFTETIIVSDLSIDGDYLIKGYYNHNVATCIYSKLGYTNNTNEYKGGSMYNLYNPDNDWYFIAIKEADTPTFENANDSQRPLGSLVARTFLIDEEGLTDFAITANYEGALQVYLNGLLLANRLDYELIDDITIRLVEGTMVGDVLTYVFIANPDSDGIVIDTIEVPDTILSGPTNGEGENYVYYNTTQGKYEIYTELEPVNANDIIVTINGVTLANNIDYYQSISNPNRIILEGNLMVGDVINIIYNAFPEYVGEVYEAMPNIFWNIESPQIANGVFTLEVATDQAMTNIVYSTQVNYVPNQPSYAARIMVSGMVGEVLYYRVINEKNYMSVTGDIIKSIAYSEVVPIIILSNAINSY